MSKPERRVEFDTLNLFGKALYVGGSAVRILANAIDTVIDHAVDVVLDAEKAFKQGLDPNVEDAKILQETTLDRSKTRKRRKSARGAAEEESAASDG